MKTRRLISHIEAEQTTYVEWCPDGAHFLTATTAPRLRVKNGFKLWHFTGKLLYEKQLPEGTQLLQIGWSPEGTGRFVEPYIDVQKISALTQSLPKREAYVPPHLRARNALGKSSPSEPSNSVSSDIDAASFKQLSRNRKKKEAKKMSKEGNEVTEELPEDVSAMQPGPCGTERTEREKRMLAITRVSDRPPAVECLFVQKLRQISTLKEKIEAGQKMQANQAHKLASEAALLAELETLKNKVNL
ncbi:eIF2A domain containing protein [Trichuris trichiura]|uniref:eIF2A domain containing protein n=1 Tax=Trichuris trichiura TaxID=36087 RepID=A0A077YXS5_TRITR|nr:eIF2A domain containing protein [Trichuris trichiura]